VLKKLRAYYQTLKPERTYANVITTGAGFLLASRWQVHWWLLLAIVIGTTLVVLSACAANNCTDRGVDAKMPRTKKRALVTGFLPIRNVAFLAIVLGIAGFVVLITSVNWLTVLIGAIAYVDYVVLYAWSKRHTIYSTLIGTISGAAPLVAGYTAVTGRFDATAVLLGILMICWQMPHFYAIGIFRHEDYRAAGLPVWPVRRSLRNTQYWILLYTAGFTASCIGLAVMGAIGAIGAVTLSLLGMYWLAIGFKGFRMPDSKKWARSMFGLSLVIVLVVSVILPLATVLP